MTTLRLERRSLVVAYGDDWPEEPIYFDDKPATLGWGDVVTDPQSGRSVELKEARDYTYFELMILIHGEATDAVRT